MRTCMSMRLCVRAHWRWWIGRKTKSIRDCLSVWICLPVCIGVLVHGRGLLDGGSKRSVRACMRACMQASERASGIGWSRLVFSAIKPLIICVYVCMREGVFVWCARARQTLTNASLLEICMPTYLPMYCPPFLQLSMSLSLSLSLSPSLPHFSLSLSHSHSLSSPPSPSLLPCVTLLSRSPALPISHAPSFAATLSLPSIITHSLLDSPPRVRPNACMHARASLLHHLIRSQERAYSETHPP